MASIPTGLAPGDTCDVSWWARRSAPSRGWAGSASLFGKLEWDPAYDYKRERSRD